MKSKEVYDFAGWATKANLLCSDGRVIRKNAFEDCDGTTVPLCWNHAHNAPDEVLGHALLENRDEGVYAYCTFNDTEAGQNAKLLVQHGDITQMSIYANKLKQQGSNVVHGIIREVSLVLAGANPGAYIESVLMHGDDSCEEGNIFTGEDFDYILPLSHSADSKKGEENVENNKDDETIQDVIDTLNEKQRKAVYALIAMVAQDAEKSEGNDNSAASDDSKSKKNEVQHSAGDSAENENEDENEAGDDETIQDVLNTLDEKQLKVVYALIGMAREDAAADTENKGGNDNMKHNVFDNDTENQDVLSHAEMEEIFGEAQRNGSLRDAFLAHGITDLDVLFPDAKALTDTPEFIKRNDDWVDKVLSGVHQSPFARIKTVFADITAEEARAKGYVKGKQKIEEVFKLMKRVTNPTTVYKKQKLDRDDLLDIMDINILPWMKGELRMMMNEELARAYLIGDGRTALSEDKINEDCIRPIWKMEDLFTVKVAVDVTASTTSEERARAFITATVKSRKEYKGSGNPSMFIPEDLLTDCMLLEDKMGRVLYDTVEKLAARLRVREIIPVPVMENQTRNDSTGNTYELGGIYVNLKDYNVGTNKGGELNMFDDFDIDYNQYKYLLETRCSGTLVKPYSAVAIEFKTAAASPEPGDDQNS